MVAGAGRIWSGSDPRPLVTSASMPPALALSTIVPVPPAPAPPPPAAPAALAPSLPLIGAPLLSRVEAPLEPHEQHARERAAGEDDRVQPELGPDAAPLLDPYLGYMEDERRAREAQVHGEQRRRLWPGRKEHVGKRTVRQRERAPHKVQQARESEQLVYVERVLMGEEPALPARNLHTAAERDV